ncbi:MAG: AAA family ATPase [Deltaproteobacteria bacterium]|jgi:hypothetical protein|nr:AAA family ATPase [Deltaproteobacteria bacterium]
MENNQLQQPLLVSSFKEIRTNNSIYVDKTNYIHKLLSDKKYRYWFLARPRRFGKTLLIDALDHFFRGDEDYFRGLSIHAHGYDFKPSPVIRLSLANTSSSPEELGKHIIYDLEDIADREQLSLNRDLPSAALVRLITLLREKYQGASVAVLIDEYDKPILDHLDNPKMAESIRATLRDFYFGLKKVESDLRFVFVTGISKLAKTAIHSTLNNLNDITHDSTYAGICGYTEDEFLDNFSHLFDDFLISLDWLKKGKNKKDLINAILAKYNGYSWDGITEVLNPYSINNCFAQNNIGDYWLSTGPPLVLEHAIAKEPAAFFPNNLARLTAAEIDESEIGQIRPESILLQTGYLTIEKIEKIERNSYGSDGFKYEEEVTFYTLKFPNLEVWSSYKTALFRAYFPYLSTQQEKLSCLTKLTDAIIDNNVSDLEKILHSLLASTICSQPAEWEKKWKNDPDLAETFFHSIFQSLFDGLGVNLIPEAITERGRSDIDLLLKEDIYALIELKYIPKANKKSLFTDKESNSEDKIYNSSFYELKKSLQRIKYWFRASETIVIVIVLSDNADVFVKFY